MSVDNRTEINDCEDDNVDFSTTGGALGTNTDAGNLIENAASVQFLHSNVYDDTTTVDDSTGTLLSINMSDVTYYILVKANGWSTYSVAAQNLVLGDGTDRIGYATGGSDATGVPIQKQFYALKLDCSDAAANPGSADVGHHVYAGVEANLDFTTITEVGYGSLHSAKAQGNVANTWIDAMCYIANGHPNYALTINGGTSPTPETTADVVSDDEAGLLTSLGFGGLITNPKGSQFDFVGPTEWGNDTNIADVYFTANDEQWYWIGDNQGGRGIGVTHFPFRIVGNGTDTIDIKWTNLVIVNTGTRAEFIAGDTDVDVMQFDTVTFTDLGTITFTTQDAGNRFLVDCTFANCDQVDPNTIDMDDCTFNGTTDATGAMLMDENQSGTQNLTGMTFNSDGTGHGIQMNPTGAGPFTYNFDNFQNSGYGADDTTDAFVDINPVTSTVDITINLLNGSGTITVDETGYTGTLTINNAQPLQVTGVTEGAAVKMIANETVGTLTVGDVIFELLADSAGEVNTTINYEAAFGAGVDVIVRARQQGLVNFGISEDNTVFVDETTESNSSATNDMNLIVDTSPVAGQDWFYFGHAEQFTRLKLDIGTAMAGGALLDFEYWNGAWVNLSGVVDGTSDYTNTGESTISFTLPGDWATTSVDGNGPVYYIRIGYLSGTVSTAPRGRKVKLDVTRYLPFVQDNEITDTGLSTVASWTVDSISKFDDSD